MAHALVATLGESPIVVTAMVRALQVERTISIEHVYVLYPSAGTESLIERGYALIATHLQTECQVHPCPLPFPDPNSTATSLEFLRILADVLTAREQAGDTVYLSLAGGRKNMSAMMGVISQFYPCVAGLLHLLDKYDDDPQRRHFYSIAQLGEMRPEQRAAAFNPPLEQLTLVDLPFQPFADAAELRRYLATQPEAGALEDATIEPLRLPVSEAARSFFRQVFQPNRTAEMLDVWLSATAFEHFRQTLLMCDEQRVQAFWKCFYQMQDRDALKSHIAATISTSDRTFYFFKLGRRKECPFFYTQPEPVHLPERQVDAVIVCGLAIEQAAGSYDPPAAWLTANATTARHRHLNALVSDEAVLLVPIGESPMIATQTCELLKEREGFTVKYMAALYPERFTPARNSASWLAELCQQRNITFHKYPVRGLKDLDSRAACETYGAALLDTIYKLRKDYPQQQLVLSLSGGRKGMSVLALFAAQQAGIERVYHALITDTALEEQIERETNWPELRRLTMDQRAERLWMEAYDRTKFTLFRVPVIGVNAQQRPDA